MQETSVNNVDDTRPEWIRTINLFPANSLNKLVVTNELRGTIQWGKL